MFYSQLNGCFSLAPLRPCAIEPFLVTDRAEACQGMSCKSSRLGK